MEKIVRCEHCGKEIGRLVKINYPQNSFLWDKIDYDVEKFSNFGGVVSEGYLCRDCLEATIYPDEEELELTAPNFVWAIEQGV